MYIYISVCVYIYVCVCVYEYMYVCVYIGKYIEQFRPISLLNVEGKIFFGVIAKRMTRFVINNAYVNTSIQKAGVPGLLGCIEHTNVVGSNKNGKK